MRSIVILFVLCLAADFAVAANIDITVQPLTLAPGQAGLLEVDYSVDSPPQNLAQDEFAFTISPATTNGLHFVNSPAPAQDPTFGAANYVFAGNSFDSNSSTPLASIGAGSDQTIYGSDSSGTFSDTPVTSGLLGYLNVLADPAATKGETFQVSLENDPNFTQFNDQNGNVFTFSSIPGTVTIVPEPTGWMLALFGALFAVGYRAMQRRRSPVVAG